ncbi:hypothetical protein Afil01_53470 [Actinorhabdospora filicis]|uniref:Heme-binding protein n=1 Tax=Actinorhabdospora filicis TaxID=1785913 RepID=A0A9W6WD74_9ACTN|nr:heme-binding protein [Actinorhabdospora filicis]GLZ80540.1 hypothetical protein Afil01_53470 [Actinorhabdospora filicis]
MTLTPAPTMTQDEVSAAIARAQARAVELGARVSVAVVDAGGHVRGLSRMAGAAPLSARVAEAKAASAALVGRDGDGLRAMQEAWPALFAGLGEVAGRPIVAGAGIRLLREGDAGGDGPGGEIVGAIAVSGGAPEVDEECAAVGVG